MALEAAARTAWGSYQQNCEPLNAAQKHLAKLQEEKAIEAAAMESIKEAATQMARAAQAGRQAGDGAISESQPDPFDGDIEARAAKFITQNEGLSTREEECHFDHLDSQDEWRGLVGDQDTFDDTDARISKVVSQILRHGAPYRRLAMNAMGYVSLVEVYTIVRDY